MVHLLAPAPDAAPLVRSISSPPEIALATPFVRDVRARMRSGRSASSADRMARTALAAPRPAEGFRGAALGWLAERPVGGEIAQRP